MKGKQLNAITVQSGQDNLRTVDLLPIWIRVNKRWVYDVLGHPAHVLPTIWPRAVYMTAVHMVRVVVCTFYTSINIKNASVIIRVGSTIV